MLNTSRIRAAVLVVVALVAFAAGGALGGTFTNNPSTISSIVVDAGGTLEVSVDAGVAGQKCKTARTKDENMVRVLLLALEHKRSVSIKVADENCIATEVRMDK